ncbi:MAG: di-trans,poly-cis-decaprenylcistransferase, partial [Candidatus Schmidhempelia sp.]|nr:di-trans,poly-cis-decaprenylcistransferase [Candidatus Schmidhempelia sp.]
SSENWKRPQTEVSALMSLFGYALNREVNTLHKNNIKLQIIGDVSRFSEQLQKRLRIAEELTCNNTGLVLTIAANYGGRWDIINASKQIMLKINQGAFNLEQLDESFFSRYLSLSELPAIDLVIRTGGEYRISNFLLWQIAYAELYFTEVLWPDFDEKVFMQAVDFFQSRERRFGSISE